MPIELRNTFHSLEFRQLKLLFPNYLLHKTGCIVTAEEHNKFGGLGESVARCLAQNNPTPQEFVAVDDTFGESATPAQLMEKYNINDAAVVNAVKKVLKRK